MEFVLKAIIAVEKKKTIKKTLSNALTYFLVKSYDKDKSLPITLLSPSPLSIYCENI